MFHVKHSVPHVLLINPWIYDFAAYNLWTRPLGLLEIGGSLRDHGVRVSLIDCTDAENFSVQSRFKPKINPFGTSKLKRTPIDKPGVLSDVPRNYCRYGISPDDYISRLKALPSPDLILVTSVMTYWYPGVRDAIAIAKEVFPEAPVWLGGVYASLLPEHAKKICRPDRIFPGPFTRQKFEDFCAFLGISNGETHSSPLHGLPFWEGYETHHFLCTRTSVGCPFHCPYCASNILTPRFREVPVPETLRVLRKAHDIFHVSDIAFYDDALLVNSAHRLEPLLESVTAQRLPLRFHTPNGIHIRLIDEKTAALMKAAGFMTLRLSLETTDPSRLAASDDKVTVAEFDYALACLFKAGFTAENIQVYLLVGLPGQSLGEIETSIDEVLSRGIRPSLAEFSPIPGTPLWETAIRSSLYPLEEEPLTHNNTLIPCGGKTITKEVLDGLRHKIREKVVGRKGNKGKNHSHAKPQRRKENKMRNEKNVSHSPEI
jgi:hypothetical protein